ncbi:transcriptional regulator [Thioclava dalianensis]|uniref:Transcriptional regulator n=1 Tax=Thioclava dalianensis TaxID=1185766 RepID=A0A074TG12_9RHOB|nr:response regulator transcription factor [Thioclava dalianensis]KEP67993.1 transcriptional regulator [Thioclava dalianensis]SFN76153.1 DNA-binding response regulator, OmpR family, contains REC and winged-helix (wHTH) domain [Thioclava dalianensis]
MRLLLIEDNRRLASLIRDGLSRQGFAIDWCETANAAKSALAISDYDLLLLDLGLPDEDGLDCIRQIRTGGNTVPILILTARGGLDDRVTGLDAGADDYVIKPIQIAELAARCRALLRRPRTMLGTKLQAGNVMLESAERAFSVAGSPVNATPREVDLLEALLRRSGHVATKQMLDNTLYAMGAEVTPNALEASVSRLRKRLSRAAADVEIRTVHGVGYGLFVQSRSDN